MIPFVNWFWKRKKSPDFDYQWGKSHREALENFTESNREYDARLHSFEKNLDPNQYEDFMKLRQVANDVNFHWQRVETLGEIMNKSNPPLNWDN